MPGKHKFTKKQDRMAAHVAKSEKKSGMSAKEAKSVGYATVQKMKDKKKFNKRKYEATRKSVFGLNKKG